MSLLPRDRSLRRLLLTVLLVALGLRVAAACILQYLLDHHWHRQFLIEGDANGYWELAERLARGETYSIYTPSRYVLRMPGFPAVLALSILLFGKSLFAARLVLAVIESAACWLVYRLGAATFEERCGVLAAALAAVSPVFVVASVLVLSESCFAVAMLVSLLAVHRVYVLVREGARPARWVTGSLWCGVAMAGACYMRPSWLLSAPLYGCGLVLVSPHRLRAAGAAVLIVAGLVLALFPWGVRNYQVTGHFTLTTFWVGPSLYDGLNPRATGDSDMNFFDKEKLSLTMSEYEVDQHYRDRAWEFARSHPWRVVELAWEKSVRFWKPWPNADQFRGWPACLAVSVFYLPALFLALWGVGVLLARCDGGLSQAIWSVAVLFGPILYFAALHMVFVSSLRYRLPAEYSLMVLSAWGLLNLWGRCCRPVQSSTESKDEATHS